MTILLLRFFGSLFFAFVAIMFGVVLVRVYKEGIAGVREHRLKEIKRKRSIQIWKDLTK